MIFPRTISLALTLALIAPVPASYARPLPDEAGARVMTISTHGASTHQRLTLSLDKAAVVQLDADARGQFGDLRQRQFAGEDDAADYLSLISLLHRRLDDCVLTHPGGSL